MDAGRESVLIAIPFTAGVAAANYSLQIFSISRTGIETAASIAVALTLAAAAALWSISFPCHDRISRADGPDTPDGGKYDTERDLAARKSVLWILFLAAGTAISLVNSIPHVSGPDETGFAGRCAEGLKGLVDSIPFGDSGNNALLKAFLTGDQGSLERSVKSAFRDSGASHLLALSGMHLSIIYIVISRFLSIMGNAPAIRITRSAAIIAGSAFFTVMTGAVPSLVRAFFFILLRECALLTGRNADSINIFCVALLVQLSITPEVVTSVGFQLSYLAMLGIFLLYRPIDRIWDGAGSATESDIITGLPAGEDLDEDTGPRTWKETLERTVPDSLRHIWSMCALSIACQVFTAPAVFLYFGTFPQYFLITNLLCIPLSNLIMVLSIIILPFHAAGICPQFIIDADGLLLSALTDILGIISTM